MISQLGATVIICASVFGFLAAVAVALRVYVRYMTRTKLDASDYTIFLTLLIAMCHVTTCIIGVVACGVGEPLQNFPDYKLSRYEKVLFAAQFFYAASLYTVKVSVVSFYKSIFSIPRFQKIANATLYVLTAWFIASFFVTLFQKHPIEANWETVVGGTSIDFLTYYIVQIVINIVLDVLILCMPLPLIFKLRITTSKKWMLVGTFWLGAFCVMSSIARLCYMIQFSISYHNGDPLDTESVTRTVLWGAIEPSASIVAACLPLLKPLVSNPHAVVELGRELSWMRPSIPSSQRTPPPTSRAFRQIGQRSSVPYSGRNSGGFFNDTTTDKKTRRPRDGIVVETGYQITIESV